MHPPFVSPEQLAAYTQGKVSASDPRLAALLDGASAAVRRLCGWHVWPEVEETARLDGPGGREVALPTLRLVSLGAVVELGEAVDPETLRWSTLGNVRRSSCWTDEYGALSVTFTHGFDEVPDVAQIVAQVVSAALSSPMGATREQVGAFAVSWATTAPGVAGGLSLLERDLAVLDQYRLRGA